MFHRREKFKFDFKKILESIMIVMLSYGFVANVFHMIAIHKSYKLDVNKFFEVKAVKKTISSLEKRLDEIESKDADVKGIKKHVQTYIDLEKKSFIYRLEGKKSITEIDKFYMVYEEHKFARLYQAIITMSEFDSSVNNVLETLRTSFMSSIYTTEPIFRELLNNYKYSSIDLFSGADNNPYVDFIAINNQNKTFLSTADYIVTWLEDYTGGTDE